MQGKVLEILFCKKSKINYYNIEVVLLLLSLYFCFCCCSSCYWCLI